MSKHTKKPWRVRGRIIEAELEPGKWVLIGAATSPPGTSFEEIHANARVMASGPAMLTMLKHFVRWYDQLTKQDVKLAEDLIFILEGEANAEHE
jgi:hypothetical protein